MEGRPQERRNNTFPGSSIVFIKDMLDADLNVYQIFTIKEFKNMVHAILHHMLVKHSRESIKRTVYTESDNNNMAI